jgi:hypothetical protein
MTLVLRSRTVSPSEMREPWLIPRGTTTVNANARDYHSYSVWLENSGEDLAPRSALGASIDVDVAILGAEFTGLSTAYCLLRRDPSPIARVEREITDFGLIRPM